MSTRRRETGLWRKLDPDFIWPMQPHFVASHNEPVGGNGTSFLGRLPREAEISTDLNVLRERA